MSHSNIDLVRILNILEHFHPVSTDFKKLFTELLHFEFKKRGFHLLHQREVQMGIWFIISGSVRAFKNDLNLKLTEQTIWFWFKHHIIINPKFYDNGQSPYFIEVLEDCYLAYIDAEELELLKKSGTDMDILLSKIRSHYEDLNAQHHQDVLRKTAKQLYDQLLKEHPAIFNYVKIKDVASFLGIAADTLYKLRKKSG